MCGVTVTLTPSSNCLYLNARRASCGLTQPPFCFHEHTNTSWANFSSRLNPHQTYFRDRHLVYQNVGDAIATDCFVSLSLRAAELVQKKSHITSLVWAHPKWHTADYDSSWFSFPPSCHNAFLMPWTAHFIQCYELWKNSGKCVRMDKTLDQELPLDRSTILFATTYHINIRHYVIHLSGFLGNDQLGFRTDFRDIWSLDNITGRVRRLNFPRMSESFHWSYAVAGMGRILTTGHFSMRLNLIVDAFWSAAVCSVLTASCEGSFVTFLTWRQCRRI